MATRQEVRVVGLTFRPGYPETVHAIAEAIEQDAHDQIRSATRLDGGPSTPLRPVALIEWDADNAADPNAVAVHVPMLGRRSFVGFIPKELAARWAKRLDQGEKVTAEVTAVPIDPLHLDRPALEITVLFHDPGCPTTQDGCNCEDPAPRDTSRITAATWDHY